MLKDEERISYDKVHQYELDPVNGIAIRPRNQKYVENDAAIRQLVIEFDALANPTEEQTIMHLRTLQHRLKKNNFDNWDV